MLRSSHTTSQNGLNTGPKMTFLHSRAFEWDNADYTDAASLRSSCQYEEDGTISFHILIRFDRVIFYGSEDAQDRISGESIEDYEARIFRFNEGRVGLFHGNELIRQSNSDIRLLGAVSEFGYSDISFKLSSSEMRKILRDIRTPLKIKFLSKDKFTRNNGIPISIYFDNIYVNYFNSVSASLKCFDYRGRYPGELSAQYYARFGADSSAQSPRQKFPRSPQFILGSEGIERVTFKSGSYNLDEEQLNNIASFSNYMKKETDFIIIISGHASSYERNAGTNAAAQHLSEKRANQVRNAFLLNGINADRIEVIGLGYNSPIAEELTADAVLLNQSVTISAVYK